MKLKSEKLYLLLPIIIIVNTTALYLWKQIGWTKPTIVCTLFGIGTILFFFLMNQFFEYLQGNKGFIIGGTIFCVLCGLYLWIGYEQPYMGIFLAFSAISSLFAGLLEGRMKKILSIAAIVVAGAALFFELTEIKLGIKPIVGKVPDVQQERVAKSLNPTQVPKSEATMSEPKQHNTTDVVDMINQRLSPEQREDPAFQELMEIIASESFQEKLEQHKPKTLDEMIHFFVSQGFTDFSESDFQKVFADGYRMEEADYKAKNPGQSPEDEDDVMAHRMVEALQGDGLMAGTANFMKDRDNVRWINARFKGDQETFNEWWKGVRSLYEAGNLPAPPHAASTDVEATPELREGTVDGEILTGSPFAETEQDSAARVPTNLWKEPKDTGPENRRVTAPVVEPEKVVTQVSPELPAFPIEQELEMSLRERFSSERYDRAIATLDRYGPEEGVRRLREDDPEIAEQVERYRNRESRVEDSR